MNIFIFLFLLFILLTSVVLGIIFFQIPSLNYSTTGCDTEEGKTKIKSALELYDTLSVVLLVALGIIGVYPTIIFILNLFLKLFTGIGGSIVKIIVSLIELSIVITLIIILSVILFDIRSVKETPCADKAKLIEKMNRIYNLVRIMFIGSAIISVFIIIGIIVYLVKKFRKPKTSSDEQIGDYTEVSSEQSNEIVETQMEQPGPEIKNVIQP